MLSWLGIYRMKACLCPMADADFEQDHGPNGQHSSMEHVESRCRRSATMSRSVHDVQSWWRRLKPRTPHVTSLLASFMTVLHMFCSLSNVVSTLQRQSAKAFARLMSFELFRAQVSFIRWFLPLDAQSRTFLLQGFSLRQCRPFLNSSRSLAYTSE